MMRSAQLWLCSKGDRAAHLEQLVGAVGRADAQLLQQLDQQAAEALERPWQPHLRIYLHLPAHRGHSLGQCSTQECRATMAPDSTLQRT